MAETERRKPSPEQLLRQLEADERHYRRSPLKVFLGYGSGVGKSFRMLDEGRRRKSRGQDVVVAAVQPDPSPEIVELLKGFEIIPPRVQAGFQAIDVEGVRLRRPTVCLIDGLAYRNPPGSRNSERWQDVEELLDAGISVITTVNLQYVRERQAQVEAIRGRKVQESVPESFLRQADDIELVDAPADRRTGLTDLPAGPGEASRQHQTSELREIALLLAAEVVDNQLERYLRRQGVEQTWGTHERILVCITPRSNASLMILRGKRHAERFHGELIVAYVEQDDLSDTDRTSLAANLAVAHHAKAHVEILRGEDPIAALVTFAESQGITQIFVGHSQSSGWLNRLRANPVERLILETEGIDIRVFPHAAASGRR